MPDELNNYKSEQLSLAEAYLRLKELDSLLEGLRSAVTRVSSSRVPGLVIKLSNLLSESEGLVRRVRYTEHSVTVGGTSIADINLVLITLNDQINFFSLIIERQDLSEEATTIIKESITKFQSTKENLLRKHEEVIWKVELLE